MTEDILKAATKIADDWAKHWLREGRLDQLDKLPRNDLIERIATALASKSTKTSKPKA